MSFATFWDDNENDGMQDFSEDYQLRFESDPREFWIKNNIWTNFGQFVIHMHQLMFIFSLINNAGFPCVLNLARMQAVLGLPTWKSYIFMRLRREK